MSLSIRPTENELRDARRVIENTWKSYEYSLELEKPEVYLTWQSFDRASSLIAAHEEIMISIDPDKEFEDELRESVLLGLLEREFRERAPYDIEFQWQGIAKMSYVWKRKSALTDEKIPDHDLTASWELLRKDLDADNVSEELYNNSGTIAARIAESLDDADEALEFKKSDIMKLSDEIFG